MDRLSCDRMFVAVMETGSFAAAAARPGTSSGQASKLVSRLEADLGVRLLNRTTRAVAATEVGQAYYEGIRALMDDFDALDQSVRNTARVPRGRLRLSAPLSFGTLHLAPALNDFARDYPDIALDVRFTDRMVNLVDEGYDAAVRVGQAGDSGLIARRLCGMRVLSVAAPHYLARRGVPQQPADLATHDCIIDTNFRDSAHWRFAADVTTPVAGRLHYSNASACLKAAEAGLGVARVPDFVVAGSIAAGRVQEVLAAHVPEPYGIFALYPQGRHLAAKVRVLVDFLVERFRAPVTTPCSMPD